MCPPFRESFVSVKHYVSGIAFCLKRHSGILSPFHPLALVVNNMLAIKFAFSGDVGLGGAAGFRPHIFRLDIL